MTREEALLEANRIVAESIESKDRLVQEVIADHLIRLTTPKPDSTFKCSGAGKVDPDA